MSCYCHFSRAFAGFALIAAAVLMTGCGKEPQKADISGTITLNGKAPNLDGLEINFVSEAGGAGVSASVNKDGTFTANGVPLGKVFAGLTYAPPEAHYAQAKAAGDARIKKREAQEKLAKGEKIDPKALLPDDPTKKQAALKNPIPAGLRDPHTSGKSIVVEAGKQNTLTWDIRP
jgi:hypothetical protein